MIKPAFFFSALVALGALASCQPSPDASDGGTDSGGTDSGGTDAGPPNQCTAPTGPGTTHSGNVAADETWTAADSPHVVSSSISVAQAATLTIEPCAVVQIHGGDGLTINGKLVADADAAHPITIDAMDASQPWSYIRTIGGSIDLQSVALSHGGYNGDPNGLGVIDVRAGGQPTPLLRAVDVTIDGSQQFGVSLREGATFTADSANLTVRNATLGPIRASAPLAGSIPTGSYTGNTIDEILLIADTAIVNDTTYRDLGVPYRLGDTLGNGIDLRVGTPSSAKTKLTVEPGVTVRVSPGGRILMASQGSGMPATGVLVAAGTAAKPIVFTSAAAAPAAGDWVALWFDGVADAQDVVDYVHVEYAGGPSLAKSYHCDSSGGLNEEEDASIILLSGQPPSAFVTNTTITAGAAYGIDRGYSGALVDFVPTNTFDVAKCKQSYPRDTNGSCPSTVPCP
jgi:hypothetical protein